MKRTALLASTAVLCALAFAPATAPAARGDGDQATYPPEYFRSATPEVIVQKRSKKAKQAKLFKGHWGWFHFRRTWSYRTAIRKARLVRDGSSASDAALALGVALGGPAGAAAAGAIANIGLRTIANRVTDTAVDSHHRGVRLELGLWVTACRYRPIPAGRGS